RLAALVHPREPAGGMFGRGRVRGSSGLGQGLGRVRGGRLARGTDRGLWTDHGFDERPRGLRQAPAGQPALSDAVSRTVRGAPRFRFPHPLVLLVLCVLAAAILTWVLAPGEYERRADPAAQREVVVAGTYHAVSAAPVGPFQALVAVPKGMSDAASIIFYVFLVGGAFAVVERTGALGRLVNGLTRRLAGRGMWVIPVVGFVFAWGGILIQMQEELIAFVPVLLLLVRRLGFNALIAVAISLGAAAVGAAFSPINPFQVGIAQKVAGLELLSGWELRSVALAAAWLIWIAGTMRFARRSRVPPEAADAAGTPAAGGRQAAILALVLLTFVVFVVGV